MDNDINEKLKQKYEENAIFDEKFPSIHFKIRKINRISNILFKLCSLGIISIIAVGIVTEYAIKAKYSEMVNAVHEKVNSDGGIKSYTNIVSNIKNSVVSIGDSEANLMSGEFYKNNSTGIVIDKYNKIITSYSNIKGLEKIYVKLPGNNEVIVEADLIVGDDDLDIAIIQISLNCEVELVTFSQEKEVLAGDSAVLLSNSTGDTYIDSIIPGVVTSPNRRVTIGKYNNINILELNTNISEVNKSGGIFNLNGELIGIANKKITEKINNNGLYYAIDVNLINTLVDSVNKVKEYIGVVDGGFIESDEKNSGGFYIERINTNSSAYDSGLRATDIIYEIDNIKINNMNSMYLALNNKTNNDTIICKVLKDGIIKEIEIVIQK